MAKKIHQLEQEIERLKSLAYRDELTGLYNRRGFKDEAEKFINEVIAFKKYPKRRESVLIKNFSFIVLDIDNFKKFNDSNGHDAGDRALKLLGGLVSKRVRDIDIAAR